MDFHILPECYVDTNLIETLVPPTQKHRGYNHQRGCATVAKKMQEKALKDDFALGIIDKDKKEIGYLKSFDEIADTGQLKLYKHPQKQHFFIQVVPAVEKWILANAAEVAVDLADFDLPTEFEQLKNLTKTQTSKENPNLKRLFKELKKRDSSGVKTLVKWVSYLKDNPYNADLDSLVNENE